MRFLVSENRARQYVQFSTLAIRKFSAFGRFGINLLSALNLAYCNISQNQRRFVYLLTQIFYWNKFKETLFSDPECIEPVSQTLPLKRVTIRLKRSIVTNG